jgi:hypothetical protein
MLKVLVAGPNTGSGAFLSLDPDKKFPDPGSLFIRISELMSKLRN